MRSIPGQIDMQDALEEASVPAARRHEMLLHEREKGITPGSEDARNQGCACSILDNFKGAGRRQPDGRLLFMVSEGCPLHWEAGTDA